MYHENELKAIAFMLDVPREKIYLAWGETALFINSNMQYGFTEISAMYVDDIPVVSIHNRGKAFATSEPEEFMKKCQRVLLPLMWAKLPYIQALRKVHEQESLAKELELLADVNGLFIELPKRIKDEIHLCVTRNPMKKIQAIKEVRELTQWGLAESKCFVEHYSVANQALTQNRVW